MTDPIADMLTRIRNAQLVNKREVSIPYSKLKFEVAKLLKTSKFVSAVKKDDGEKFPVLILTLKKDGIKGIQRVSTPGQRTYVGVDQLETKFKQGKGSVFVSTPQGLMEARAARKARLGGEVICRVW